MKHKVIKLLLWVGDVCNVSCGSLYICCRECSSIPPSVLPGHSLRCSTEHAHSTPLLLLLLLRMLPTPWAWCCMDTHTKTHTHTHTHSPPTCPHAHKHVNTHIHTHSQGTIWLSAVCPPVQPTQLSWAHSPEGELTFRQISLPPSAKQPA